MMDQVELMSRLLAGAIGESEAARQLRVPVGRVRGLLGDLGVARAVLAPVAFDVAAAQIELLDLAGCELREAFFEDSVQRHRRERPGLLNPSIGVGDLLVSAGQHAGAPSGFIFHTGRCGSTLLANMLSAAPDQVVLKEPGAVSDLSAARLRARTNAARDWVDAPLEATIRHLCGAVGKISGRPRCILKLVAWNVAIGGELLRLFPSTPSVFVLRRPADVVASLLFQPPAWFEVLEREPLGQALFFPSVRREGASGAASPVELFAHAWRSAVEAALALPAERVLFVDYDELVDTPEPVLGRVLAHLRQPRPAEVVQRMLEPRQLYSKGPGTRFEPQGRHRRPALSQSEQGAVARVVGELPERVAERLRRARGAGVA